MAHHAGQLVSGVCVHSTGWKPQRFCAHHPEYAGCVAAHRSVARGQLEFYPVGIYDVCVNQRGEDGMGQSHGAVPAAGASLYGARHPIDLAHLCGAGYGADRAVSVETVSISGRRGGKCVRWRLCEIWKDVRPFHDCGAHILHGIAGADISEMEVPYRHGAAFDGGVLGSGLLHLSGDG